MLKNLIYQDLKKAINSLGYNSTDIVLSISENPKFGDYNSNILLQLSKQKNKNDKQSIKIIAKQLLSLFGHPTYLERIEIVEAGFINFFIKDEYLAKELIEIIYEKEFFGHSSKYQNKNARVEFVSANPTGPLHIGNARGGPIGDVIANILQSQGYKVLREYIQNDVGNQVNQLGIVVSYKIGYPNIEGASKDPESYKAPYINQLADEVKKRILEEIGEENFQNLFSNEFEKLCTKLSVEVILEWNLQDCQDLGINFNLVVYESQLQKNIPGVIEQLKEKGLIKYQDGALWFAPSDEFLKDRETVVQKTNGEYTYFASDIVYHQQKFSTDPDLVIDEFGSGHHGHVPRLQAVVLALGFDPKKLKFILHQNVAVKKGSEIIKMSKRAGNIITAREVLDEIGKDAFRFMMLQVSVNTHLDLDIELAKQQSNKNPVYYVQYAYARMASILDKSSIKDIEVKYELLNSESEKELIRYLLEFPDLLFEISNTFAIHQLTNYSLKIADLFHKFYENNSVLYSGNEELTQSRLRLVLASKIVLGNTLDLLGIQALEKM